MKRYTAGGEATLLSLEILNVDAFVFIIAGAAPEAPLQARRHGSSGVRERLHSHGMARRGTWEALHCPRQRAGWTTGRNKGSGPAPACGGSGANKQAQRGTGWRINKPKGCRAGSRSGLIVLLTAGNRDRRDPSEGRGSPHGQNHWRETLEETMSSTNTSTQRQWIAEKAREHPEWVFTTLHRFIDLEWMREAYRLTRKDGAAGIDGVTAADYEKDLEANLLDLLGRIKSGSYVAPPVRRHYIPKADGTMRPLGIPTFEDKVAQRAIVMLMEPVYEADFLPCSHGFRPGRSAHDAVRAVREGTMGGLRWVIDADVSKYFDTISHQHLRAFLDLRIKDGVVRRMLDKWLLPERSGKSHYGNPANIGTCDR